MLYHVSENSSMRSFTPRMPPPTNTQLLDPVVWAVDEDHLHNYMFPRDFPQIDDLLSELNKMNIELRVLPELLELADDVSKSTLGFSCIRLRNAGRGA